MEKKVKSDALRVGEKGQHEIRKTIIRMLKDGKKCTEIVRMLDVSKGHVSYVKKRYEKGGAKALKPAKRGQPAGKNKILTIEQEKEIQRIIVDKTPEQLRCTDIPVPACKPGWSLVMVKGFGSHRSEVFTRKGYSPRERSVKYLF